MPASASEPPAQNWKKRLSVVSLTAAILLPLFYGGLVWWIVAMRDSHDQDPLPALSFIAVLILASFLTTATSIVAVVFSRRSAIAWSAAILSLLESSAAIFLILALRNLHF